MKPTSILLLLTLTSVLFAEKKPNIIVIMADDHGAAVMSVVMARNLKNLKTPH